MNELISAGQIERLGNGVYVIPGHQTEYQSPQGRIRRARKNEIKACLKAKGQLSQRRIIELARVEGKPIPAGSINVCLRELFAGGEIIKLKSGVYALASYRGKYRPRPSRQGKIRRARQARIKAVLRLHDQLSRREIFNAIATRGKTVPSTSADTCLQELVANGEVRWVKYGVYAIAEKPKPVRKKTEKPARVVTEKIDDQVRPARNKAGPAYVPVGRKVMAVIDKWGPGLIKAPDEIIDELEQQGESFADRDGAIAIATSMLNRRQRHAQTQ